MTTAVSLCLALSAGPVQAQSDNSGQNAPASQAQNVLSLDDIPADIRPPTPEEQVQMDGLDRDKGAAMKAGDLARARALAERLRELESRTWGPEHPWTIGTVEFIAQTYRVAGDTAQALRTQEQAVASFTARLGAGHWASLAASGKIVVDQTELGLIDPRQAVTRLRAIAEALGELGQNGPQFGTLRLIADLAEAREMDAEATQALQGIVDIAIAVTGADSAVTASWRKRWDRSRSQPAARLNAQALTAIREGRYREAEPLARSSAEIFERTLGPDDQSTLISQSNLAFALVKLGRAAQAEPIDRHVLARREHLLGPDHPDTLMSLGNLASTVRALGRTREASEIERRVLNTRERDLGPEHPDTLLSMNNLADTLLVLRQESEAEAMHRKVLEIRERELGPDHPDTLTTLNNLGAVLLALGRAAEAEALFRRNARSYAHSLGPEHPETLQSLGNQAAALNALGRPNAAEPIVRQVLAIRERTLGPDHPATQIGLNNLATTLDALGRLEEAETFHRRVLEARSKALGAEHPAALASLNNLASTLSSLKRYEEAVDLNRRVLASRERTLGPEHPDTLDSLNNLASTMSSLNRHEEAVEMHRRVLAGRERNLGPEHPDTLQSLNNLALSLAGIGRVAEAEDLYRRALDGKRRLFGPDHPTTWVSLNNLAFAQMKAENYAEALVSARLAFTGYRTAARTGGTVEATRKERAREAARNGRLLTRIAWELTDAGNTGEAGEALRAEAFLAAQAGGSGTATALARTAARIAAGEAGLAEIVEGWERALAARATVDQRIVDLATSPDLDETSKLAARTALFAEREAYETAIGDADSRLRTDFPRFFDLLNPGPVGLEELQGAKGATLAGDPLLGEDEALVLLLPGLVGRNGLVWAVSRDAVGWAEIPFDEDELTAMIGQLHDQLGGGNRSGVALWGDAGQGRGGQRAYDRELAHRIYAALFGAPEIAAVLSDKPDWILAPHGVFLSLPFAALVTRPPQGSDSDTAALRATAWMGLERALAVVPSVATVRTLRRQSGGNTAASKPFFGLGDPAFTGAPGDRRALGDGADFFRGDAAETEAVRALPRLPGTRAEVQAMATAFGVGPESYLLGAKANETRLAALSDSGELRSARVLLLATHGLMAGAFDGLAEPALALSPPEGEPLLIDRASGAAGALDTPAPAGARLDDGLLTASEAARLDLNADWVILSACDTAAGAENSPDAEGLSGLARAFFYAGARSLLVSYWPVDDATAARLTTDAVRRAEADPNLTRARAFQAAMRDILTDTSSPANAHPSRWAPFQIIGVQAGMK